MGQLTITILSHAVWTDYTVMVLCDTVWMKKYLTDLDRWFRLTLDASEGSLNMV